MRAGVPLVPRVLLLAATVVVAAAAGRHRSAREPLRADTAARRLSGGCSGTAVGAMGGNTPSSGLAAADCAAWQAFFDAMGGANWRTCSASDCVRWSEFRNIRSDPCDVQVNDRPGNYGPNGAKCVGGHITQIAIYREGGMRRRRQWAALDSLKNDIPKAGTIVMGYNGTLPAELADLPELSSLSFMSHISEEAMRYHKIERAIQIHGTLPPEWTKMTKLKELRLLYAFLEGPFPDWSGMSSLTSLQLDGRCTHCSPCGPGSIDSGECAKASSWKGTEFNPFHANVATLPALQKLTVDGGHGTPKVRETLPREWSAMTALTHLYLYKVGVVGSLPPEWSRMSALQSLTVYDEPSLVGELPPGWSALAPTLHTLVLQFNRVGGTLPPEWGQLTELKDLNLRASMYDGGLPPAWAGMSKLRKLDLQANNLGGEIPPEWDAFGDVALEDRQYAWINLAENRLEGTVPEYGGRKPDQNFFDCTGFEEHFFASKFGAHCCPSGKYFGGYLPQKREKDVDCPAGQYSGTAQVVDCGGCPSGQHASAKTTSAQHDANNGADDPSLCSGCAAGRFKGRTLGGDCGLCPAGKYQAQLAQEACTGCPAGQFSNNGSAPMLNTCENCPAGEYSASGSRLCSTCPAGKYSNRGAPQCAACAPGEYMPDRTSAGPCKPCTEATYAQLEASERCLPCAYIDGGRRPITGGEGASSPDQCKATKVTAVCPAGQATESSDAQNCRDCRPGRFKVQRSDAPCEPCPCGTFSGAGESVACRASCPRGKFGNATSATCDACPARHFCVQSRKRPFSEAAACIPGRFVATNVSASSDRACAKCPPGKFQGAMNGQSCRACTAGRHQPAPEQAFCAPCAVGKYGDRPGQAAADAGCKGCAAGLYNDQLGQSTAAACKHCAEGKFSDQLALAAAGGCKSCAAGRYSARSARPTESDCKLCADGEYSDRRGAVGCLKCPPGHQCEGGKKLPCDLGRYGDVSGQASCKRCVAGQYQTEKGKVACAACAAGKAGSGPDQAVVSYCADCDVGRYSAIGATTCTACAAGQAQGVAGSASCVECNGTDAFQDQAAQTSCKTCQAGSYRESASSCIECPPGYTCNGRARSKCAAGRYNDASGQTACKDCAAGQYQATAGKAACDACAAGKLGSGKDRARAAHCANCTAGRYSASGATACKECAAGRHQPAPGVASCIACTGGTYQSNSGQIDCLKCDECPSGLQRDSCAGVFEGFCVPCAPGNFVDGSGVCVACPIGQFTDDVSQTRCYECAAGQFQDQQGQPSCLRHRDCHAGESIAMDGTRTRDRECRVCADTGRDTNFSTTRNAQRCTSCRKACPGNAPRKSCGGASEGYCGGCSPGTRLRNRVCEKCEAGRYSASENAPNCTACPGGRYQQEAGKTFCNAEAQCIPGDFVLDAGNRTHDSTCAPCPPNTFSAATHSRSCASCATQACDAEGGILTVGCGGSSAGVCIQCYPGRFVNRTARRCQPCPRDTYQDVANQTLCKPCESGKRCDNVGLASGRTCEAGDACQVLNDTAWAALTHGMTEEQRADAKLNKCPYGWHCPDGTLDGTNVRACTADEVWDGTARCERCERSDQFAINNATRPWLAIKLGMTDMCVQCPAALNNESDCSEVSFVHNMPWEFCLALSFFMLLFIWSDARCHWKRGRFLQRHLQGARQQLVGKCKIVLSFFQILSLSTTVFRAPFPSVFAAFVKKLAFLRFDLFTLVPIQCIAVFDFHDVLDASMVLAFVMLLPPSIKLLTQRNACWGNQRSEDGGGKKKSIPGLDAFRRWSDWAIGWLTVFTYVLYPSVSSIFFQSFSCEAIELGTMRSNAAQPPARSRWLHQDYAVDCDSAKHQVYETWAAAMIVAFAFGVPILFLALLCKWRHHLQHEGAQYLSFLFRDYRPDMWYWEIFECFRKLTFTGVALFFGEQGSLIQIGAAATLAMLYVVLLTKAQPYTLPSDNALAQLVGTGTFITLMAAMLLKVKIAFVSTGRFGVGFSEDTLSVALIIVVLVVFVAWSASLVADVRHFAANQSFRYEGTDELLTMPDLEKLGKYHVFMSHSQQDGGDQVAHIKKELEEYVGTINIFTDVAAGSSKVVGRERALSAKSELYGCIEQSEVFLVFLTKSYFTRKWCVKEFQEACVTGKTMVVVLDVDVRHGGMRPRDFVSYATSQRERSEADAASGASNLWCQAQASGDKELEELCQWVAGHVTLGEARQNWPLVIKSFGDTPQRTFPLIPWYRYASEKRISLQLMVEEMLKSDADDWNYPPGRRRLKLELPRPKLRTSGRGDHLFLSAHHRGSHAIKAALETACARVRVYLPGGEEADADARRVRGCQAMLVVVSASPDTRRWPLSQFTSDVSYQRDMRVAVDAGLDMVLMLQIDVDLVQMTSPLWAGAGMGMGHLTERHLRALLDPIAIRCQPEFAAASNTSSTAADLTLSGMAHASRWQHLFDRSTTTQILHRVAAAAGGSETLLCGAKLAATLWARVMRDVYRGEGGAGRAPEEAREQEGTEAAAKFTENPMYARDAGVVRGASTTTVGRARNLYMSQDFSDSAEQEQV
eukprot:g2392.t1